MEERVHVGEGIVADGVALRRAAERHELDHGTGFCRSIPGGIPDRLGDGVVPIRILVRSSGSRRGFFLRFELELFPAALPPPGGIYGGKTPQIAGKAVAGGQPGYQTPPSRLGSGGADSPSLLSARSAFSEFSSPGNTPREGDEDEESGARAREAAARRAAESADARKPHVTRPRKGGRRR